MPEEKDETIESPEEITEDTEPLFGDDSVDDPGNLADEEVEVDERAEGELEPEKAKLYADKYKTVEELERGYKEAQGALTRTSQERADLLKWVQGIALKQAGADTVGKPTEEDVQSKVDDILAEISTDPNYLPKLIRQSMQEVTRTAEEYDTTISTAIDGAISSIGDDESFGKQFTPEVRAEMQKDLDGNELVQWLMNDVITSDNFKGAKVDINEFYGKVMNLLSQAALGRIAAKIVPETKVKARREAKKEYLQKQRLVSQKPRAKGGKLAGKQEADSFSQFLDSRKRAKGSVK